MTIAPPTITTTVGLFLHRHEFARSRTTASTRSKAPRSPSPIITFTPTNLPSDAKSVKDITRKVIRTLEGLGHLDNQDMSEPDDTSEAEDDLRISSNTMSHGNCFPKGIPTGLHEKTLQIGRPAHDRPKKTDWEIPRKVLHTSIGFLTIYLYIFHGDVKSVVLSLWTALAIIVPADILRFRYPSFERLFERFLGFLMRESEKESSNGVIWYILGVNFALTFYPQDIAVVAILILSWADTTASIFGRLWGSKTSRLPAHTPVLRLPLAPRKSVAGFIAAAVTGAFIAICFWGWIAPLQHSNIELSWSWNDGARSLSTMTFMGYSHHTLPIIIGWIKLGAIGIFSGLVSGVAEALAIGSLDDNLTLPIISGACIWGFLKFLQFLSSS